MRRHDKHVWSTLPLALALCLLVGMLAACGAAGEYGTIPPMLVLSSVGNTGDTTSSGSLWDKTLMVVPEEIPQEALGGEEALCCGVGANNRLLMLSETAVWLYDPETEERLPLLPGNSETEAYLRLILTNMGEDAEQLPAEELLNRLIAVRFAAEPILWKNPAYCEQRSGAWLYLGLAESIPCLVDTRSGLFYSERDHKYVDGSDSQIFRMPVGFESPDLYDLESGTTLPFLLVNFGGGRRPTAYSCGFLPDGGKYVVLFKNGQLQLELLTADGKSEQYELGSFWQRYPGGPKMVWPVGDTAVLVSGQQSNLPSPHITVLIDRLSGTVSLLWMENLRLESGPLSEFLDEKGNVRFPEEWNGSTAIFPISSLEDGKTALLYYGSSPSLALFRPESMELKTVLNSPGVGEKLRPELVYGGDELLVNQKSHELLRLQVLGGS